LRGVKKNHSARVTFITGTDTGVGKSVLAALLLRHLRQSGVHALGVKPFCSGGWGDVHLMRAAQDRELMPEEITPFFFPEPVTPLVSMRLHKRPVALEAVLECIQKQAERCERLIIEGAGGLLAPLGEDYTALTIITRLSCEVMLVTPNKLGTINHTLLTVKALEQAGVRQIRVIMMGSGSKDASVASNADLLEETLGNRAFFRVPFLGKRCRRIEAIRRHEKKFRKTLALISE
jgi:dethiobiotin synthetase